VCGKELSISYCTRFFASDAPIVTTAGLLSIENH